MHTALNLQGPSSSVLGMYVRPSGIFMHEQFYKLPDSSSAESSVRKLPPVSEASEAHLSWFKEGKGFAGDWSYRGLRNSLYK